MKDARMQFEQGEEHLHNKMEMDAETHTHSSSIRRSSVSVQTNELAEQRAEIAEQRSIIADQMPTRFRSKGYPRANANNWSFTKGAAFPPETSQREEEDFQRRSRAAAAHGVPGRMKTNQRETSGGGKMKELGITQAKVLDLEAIVGIET